MSKEIFEVVKKESVYIGILFLIGLIILKIIYYKDSFIVSLRFALSLFWLFVLPGYCIMIYWEEKLDFLERFVIGIALSAAVIGILSYYLGLIGLNIKYHGILLPAALVLAGIAFNLRK
ncbi:hypothetical protein HY637_01130 [Candidatus Woesearchaeota archaeon]|nr:hypothetical protein [Candidatus Woesearchaeota archaeon]